MMKKVAIFIKKRWRMSLPIAALAFLFLLIAILQALNYQRIALGVSVGNTNIGGLSRAEAKEKIETISQNAQKTAFKIQYKNKTWKTMPEELGIDFDAQQSFQSAANVGNEDNILLRPKEQIAALLGQKKLKLSYGFSEQRLQEFFQNRFRDFETPVKNARLSYNQKTDDFIFVSAQAGEIFDKEEFKRQIFLRLGSGQNSLIELKKITQQPILTQDKGNYAKSKAREILAFSPYLVKSGENSWPIEKQVIAEWLVFIPDEKDNETMAVSLSETAIKDFLSALAPSVNKNPVDARLAQKDGKVVEFALSQNGIELKLEESAKKISDQILAGKKEIILVTAKTKPNISTDTIDTLGLIDLIAVGTSTYTGSPKNRMHNIEVGAAKLNGALLKPGEEFSFVKMIGEIDAQNGYLPELVIKNKKTVPEYGGGICQVSTTLFRAAVNAGLKITERYPHAFPVKYYNPQGFDATIYPPNPDLRFTNDTPRHILIQSKIVGASLTFEIYGTKDDREVKIVGPKILESNPNGSMKTVLYQEIWRNGELERKDTFRSNYKSPTLYPVQRNPLE